MNVVGTVLSVVVFDQERGPLHAIVMPLVPLLTAPPGEVNVGDTRLVDLGTPLRLDVGNDVTVIPPEGRSKALSALAASGFSAGVQVFERLPTMEAVNEAAGVSAKDLANLFDDGQAGDNVGLLLRGTKREDIERGQVLAKPKSITPHTKFKAEVYVLSKDEGGRHTPFFNGYRPQFYFRTTDVTGVCTLPSGIEMVMPGDNVTMDIELITPVAMAKELRFAIREGGRTVGAGVVSEITE